MEEGFGIDLLAGRKLECRAKMVDQIAGTLRFVWVDEWRNGSQKRWNKQEHTSQEWLTGAMLANIWRLDCEVIVVWW